MKIADKLTKVDDSLRIYKYDNGYMIEVSGRDMYDDWATVKILATSLADALALVEEAFEQLPQT